MIEEAEIVTVQINHEGEVEGKLKLKYCQVLLTKPPTISHNFNELYRADEKVGVQGVTCLRRG